jgi:hypothetical protein
MKTALEVLWGAEGRPARVVNLRLTATQDGKPKETLCRPLPQRGTTTANATYLRCPKAANPFPPILRQFHQLLIQTDRTPPPSIDSSGLKHILIGAAPLGNPALSTFLRNVRSRAHPNMSVRQIYGLVETCEFSFATKNCSICVSDISKQGLWMMMAMARNAGKRERSGSRVPPS